MRKKTPHAAHKAPIDPMAAVQALAGSSSPKESKMLPVKEMLRTLEAALTVLAAEYRIAACSGAAISTWLVDHPPRDVAALAKASDESKVAMAGDLASPIQRNTTSAEKNDSPVMIFEVRTLEMPRSLMSQQYAMPPRTEKIIIVRCGEIYKRDGGGGGRGGRL